MVKEQGDISFGCPVFKCNAIWVGQVIFPCCTVAVKIASIYAGLAKTGYVITLKFDLRWLETLITVTDSTLTAVHSTAEAGGQDAIGLQDAEFFTNMAMPWILLPVFAARMCPGILSQEMSSWCVSWSRTTVTLWVFTRCSMMLIFSLVRPSIFSCSSGTLKRELAPVQCQTVTTEKFYQH